MMCGCGRCQAHGLVLPALAPVVCCRLLFSRCTAEHCTPTRDEQDGHRIFSTPYSGKWAHHMLKLIRKIDPAGLLFAIDVGWDKTTLSNVQTAYPLLLTLRPSVLLAPRDAASSALEPACRPCPRRGAPIALVG
eukprot:5311545-Prymnesium_polylepis.2